MHKRHNLVSSKGMLNFLFGFGEHLSLALLPMTAERLFDGEQCDQIRRYIRLWESF